MCSASRLFPWKQGATWCPVLQEHAQCRNKAGEFHFFLFWKPLFASCVSESRGFGREGTTGAEVLLKVWWNNSWFVLWGSTASLHAEFQFPLWREKSPKLQITAASSYLPKQIKSKFSPPFQFCSRTADFPCLQPRIWTALDLKLEKSPHIKRGKTPRINHSILRGVF